MKQGYSNFKFAGYIKPITLKLKFGPLGFRGMSRSDNTATVDRLRVNRARKWYSRIRLHNIGPIYWLNIIFKPTGLNIFILHTVDRLHVNCARIS